MYNSKVIVKDRSAGSILGEVSIEIGIDDISAVLARFKKELDCLLCIENRLAD